MDIGILKYGDVGQNNATPRRALLDTGSGVNLVDAQILKELGLDYHRDRSVKLKTLSGLVETLGYVPILWYNQHDPTKTYMTNFLVFSARGSEETTVGFDFLLGRDWREQSTSQTVVDSYWIDWDLSQPWVVAAYHPVRMLTEQRHLPVLSQTTKTP
jgi:hypothetical protein